MQSNSIEAYFVICVEKIAVHFENPSICIITARVHKFLATLFCTVVLYLIFVVPQCGTSFMLIFRWRQIWFALYIYVKFANLWFILYAVEFKLNVGIIIQLCLLINICYIYPIKHNTFTACIHLFSTVCFGRLYWLKSGRIATMQRKSVSK
jgi:hypothetical protein